jgi:hypothetical protein
MKADDLTRHMIHELHLLDDANEQSRAVVHAMRGAATDSVLTATLTMFLDILAEEDRLLTWLLEEQGQRDEDIPSRPVEVLSRDGWLALEEGDDQLRDLEIGTVTTQL